MNRHYLDGIAERQFAQNIDQQAQCGGWEYKPVWLIFFVEDVDALGFKFGRQ